MTDFLVKQDRSRVADRWKLLLAFVAASCGGVTGPRPAQTSQAHVSTMPAEEVVPDEAILPDDEMESAEIDPERLAIDLANVERARAIVAGYGEAARIEHGHGIVEHLWLERERGRALLCVRSVAEATDIEPGVLCFEASGEPPRIELGLVDEEDGSRGYHLCIGDHLLAWPSGERRAGTCLGGLREGGSLPPFPYTAAPVPAGLEPLGPVTVHTLEDPRLITISGEVTTLLCFREVGRAECATIHEESPARWIHAVVAERDERGGRWVAWVREQPESSCPEAQNASLSAALVRHEAGSSRAHGFLPLGGWDDEVGPDWGDDIIVPFPNRLSAVDSSGCLEVVVPTEHRIVDCGGNPRVVWRRPTPPRAPAEVRGRIQDVFEAMELDFSGTWMPASEGGFRRVDSCPTL